MKNPVLIALLLGMTVVFFSCRRDPQPDMSAAIAACQYWQQLVGGDEDAFTLGLDGADTVRTSYREQMADNAHMLISELKLQHSGIDSVSVLKCLNDTTGLTAQAFLTLHFSDSTHEEIVVPMVRRGEVWKMR